MGHRRWNPPDFRRVVYRRLLPCPKKSKEGSEAIAVPQSTDTKKALGRISTDFAQFLLPRSQRAKFEPQNNFSFYRQDDQGYRMDSYAPPPPVYNPNLAAPPGYGPPQGGSKTNPSQDWIAPPAGAPPGRSTNPDVEQGVVPDAVNATPAKGGLLQKFKPKIPKLPLSK